MKLLINKVHFPVTTLGFGRRVAIWTQGCSIHCPGCISRDTWDFDSRSSIEIDDLLNGLRTWLHTADGVTISGGEPFDQPEALQHLVQRLREQMPGDILLYSGYSMEKLLRDFREILNLADVLISDPYQAKAGQTRLWRGSDNQRITLLTELAQARYGHNANEAHWPDSRRLDVMMDDDVIWMAGIPRPGDLVQLTEKMAAAGYESHSSEELRPIIRA